MNAEAMSLYERLGGYDAITAVTHNLVERLAGDALLGRFWQNRGADGIEREKQLLVDFLSESAGGPVYYTGRDMLLSHKGMKISQADWDAFITHLKATLDSFSLPEQERSDVLGFIDSTRADIVE
jgi:hemoglobin